MTEDVNTPPDNSSPPSLPSKQVRFQDNMTALPPRPSSTNIPTPPINISPFQASSHFSSKQKNALSLVQTSPTKSPSILQNMIGEIADSALLGKLSPPSHDISTFIPNPQEAPPNIYGKYIIHDHSHTLESPSDLSRSTSDHLRIAIGFNKINIRSNNNRFSL